MQSEEERNTQLLTILPTKKNQGNQLLRSCIAHRSDTGNRQVTDLGDQPDVWFRLAARCQHLASSHRLLREIGKNGSLVVNPACPGDWHAQTAGLSNETCLV